MLAYLLSICEKKYHPIIEHIYYTYQEDMVRFAKFRLRNRSIPNYEIEAEDVVQNSFIKIVTYAYRIKAKSKPQVLKSYVMQIVKNESRTFVKNFFKTPEVETLEEEFGSIEDYDATLNILGIYEDVIDIIDDLDEIYSNPLYLKFIMDFEVCEIALIMEISEKTIYTRLGRGRKMLMDKLKERVYE